MARSTAEQIARFFSNGEFLSFDQNLNLIMHLSERDIIDAYHIMIPSDDSDPKYLGYALSLAVDKVFVKTSDSIILEGEFELSALRDEDQGNDDVIVDEIIQKEFYEKEFVEECLSHFRLSHAKVIQTSLDMRTKRVETEHFCVYIYLAVVRGTSLNIKLEKIDCDTCSHRVSILSTFYCPYLYQSLCL